VVVVARLVVVAARVVVVASSVVGEAVASVVDASVLAGDSARVPEQAALVTTRPEAKSSKGRRRFVRMRVSVIALSAG
jgi:hypothetical protein